MAQCRQGWTSGWTSSVTKVEFTHIFGVTIMELMLLKLLDGEFKTGSSIGHVLTQAGQIGENRVTLE